jgi:hypothetical protein
MKYLRTYTNFNESTNNKYIDTYYVDKSYGFDNDDMKGDFYLRFTDDPISDIEHKYSRWYDASLSDEEAEEQGYIVDEHGDYYKRHTGLSGHHLDSENLEDVINEAFLKNNVYKNINIDNWAIFESNNNVNIVEDTPEGNTFFPEKLLFKRKYN